MLCKCSSTVQMSLNIVVGICVLLFFQVPGTPISMLAHQVQQVGFYTPPRHTPPRPNLPSASPSTRQCRIHRPRGQVYRIPAALMRVIEQGLPAGPLPLAPNGTASSPAPVAPPPPPTVASPGQVHCFECGSTAHKVRQCPQVDRSRVRRGAVCKPWHDARGFRSGRGGGGRGRRGNRGAQATSASKPEGQTIVYNFQHYF